MKDMISKIKKLAGFVALLAALTALPECATRREKIVVPPPALNREQIADQIELYQMVAKDHGDLSTRIDAHLQLARLYSSYKNQRPDYEQALKELETYLSFNPVKGEYDEVQNWLTLLREIVRVNEENRKSKQIINQFAKENKELRGTVEQLKGTVEQLRGTVEQLKGTVEQLKNLDIQMEERRKQVK
jgi:ABC-type transporter Mla subunit MlaD